MGIFVGAIMGAPFVLMVLQLVFLNDTAQSRTAASNLVIISANRVYFHGNYLPNTIEGKKQEFELAEQSDGWVLKTGFLTAPVSNNQVDFIRARLSAMNLLKVDGANAMV